MNYKELEQKLGKQTESDWHQASGGGWVHKDAEVINESNIRDDAIVMGNAIVSGDAIVSGNAKVYRDAQVSGNAIVSGNATVSGDAMVYGNARVCGNAMVYGDAIVSGNASVYGYAQVSGNARVCGDAWEKSPLYVTDSRNHGATNYQHGWLKIGCEERTFIDWDNNFDKIAIKHKLTDAEKIEYRAIVDLFIKIGK
jgi:carbonic anhydrase/acetyltransferase-like protein (isoleucine patch superfamily)